MHGLSANEPNNKDNMNLENFIFLNTIFDFWIEKKVRGMLEVKM